MNMKWIPKLDPLLLEAERRAAAAAALQLKLGANCQA